MPWYSGTGTYRPVLPGDYRYRPVAKNQVPVPVPEYPVATRESQKKNVSEIYAALIGTRWGEL